mmetsp:Transcript_14562/g.16917  ORF Transcript_14562/g.16917 Transcript_14562/m.16917 type:complete len:94 (-) Transcript_14562:5-286(-)
MYETESSKPPTFNLSHHIKLYCDILCDMKTRREEYIDNNYRAVALKYWDTTTITVRQKKLTKELDGRHSLFLRGCEKLIFLIFANLKSRRRTD